MPKTKSKQNKRVVGVPPPQDYLGKGVKAYAVCFALNKKCLSDDIRTFKTRSGAKDFIHELHCEAGGFEDDHHIIKVLISPIKNLTKKK